MKHLTILIIDDAEINRGILKNIFDNEYNIIEACNGQEALDILCKGVRIDIIILDIMMPVMDGMEFLKNIKTNNKFNKIPVIVNTVINEKGSEYEAIELGADDFITKPYNPKLIYNKVTNILKKYIEKRNDTEAKFKNMQIMYNSLIEAIPGGVMICDVSFSNDQQTAGLVAYNYTMKKMLAYSGDSIVEQYNDNLFNIIYDADIQSVFKAIKEGNKSRRIDCGEVRIVKVNGDTLWTKMSMKELHVDNDYRVYYQMIFNDITHEKINQEMLGNSHNDFEGFSALDMVTGLDNRISFYKNTEKMIKNHPSEEYVVINYNIDNFKVLNELFGVKTGDSVLGEFGDELKRKIKDKGTVGRFESDHFYVCVTKKYYNAHKEYFYDLASGKIKWSSINYPILLHAGICEINSEEVTMASICDAAALAVNTVKSDYFKRCNVYNDEIKADIMYQQKLVNEMEKALDEQQFYVMLQPIYNAQTQRIDSAEALVRWNHPEEGFISPGEFIPLFEENGFISRLDMFVCEKVCQYQQKRKLENKEDIPVSVNLSRVNFFNPDICSDINRMIEKYGLTANNIRFEITESIFKDNIGEISDAVNVFHNNGFYILMDDFGSGYSSLNMLKDIDMDILKIDMKFMTDMEISEKANNILYSVIQMAKGLNMKTVAEGVEKADQYELLKAMGCNYIQGYYFSKPVTIEEFDELIKENHIYHIKNDVVKKQNKCKTVLVVEDDEINRELIYEMLCDKYNVIMAVNGKDALDIIQTHFMEINLVISDIMMPVMDGFEMLQKMNKLSYCKNIPVLMVTAYSELHNKELALSYGALDVISKPYDSNIMRKRVENILRISESINIEQEVRILRENVKFKTQIESIFVNSFVGMARIELFYDDELTIRNMIFNNIMINELNGFIQSEAENVKSFYEICIKMNEYDRENVMNCMQKAIKNREEYLYNLEFMSCHDNGEKVNVSMSCSFDYYEDYFVVDIVEMDNTIDYNNSILPAFQKIIRDVVDEKDAIVWRYNIERDLFEFSDYDGNTQIIQNVRDDDRLYGIFMPRDYQRIDNMYERLRAGCESISDDFLVSTTEEEKRNGNGHWVRITYHRMYDVKKKCVAAIGILRNIEEKKNYENVRRLSRRDSLTGLYNRLTFENMVEELIKEDSEAVSAFIMVDIDEFKSVNDNFGHDFGDTVIRSIGKLLSDIFRKEDIVARIGGDEFAIFISNVKSKEVIVKRAKEICNKSCMTFENEKVSINISCSVGISFNSGENKSFHNMYVSADKAMYNAKKSGKNCFKVLD